MYSSKIVEATDPDLFAAAIRPVCDFIVTERGSFTARSTLFNLGRVYAQRADEKLARLKHSELHRGGVLFLTAPGPGMFMNGAEIGMSQIAVVEAGASYTSRISGATQWGAVTLAKEDMENLGLTRTDGCGTRSSTVTVITPPPAALARLRFVHSSMGAFEQSNPGSLANTALALGLEHSLIDALQGTLTMQQLGFDTAARRHHQIIINRFRALVEAQAQGPVLDISQKIGVSGRLLRLACQQQLGVSPGRYMMLRRMRSARLALQKADPDVTRVTDIATEHGFWELGRFAVEYRHIFGETPSATLRRAA